MKEGDRLLEQIQREAWLEALEIAKRAEEQRLTLCLLESAVNRPDELAKAIEEVKR